MTVLTRLWHRVKPKLHLPSNKATHVLSVALTYVFFILSIVVFRAESLSQAGVIFQRLFAFEGSSLSTAFTEFFQVPEFFYVMKVLGLDALPYAHTYCMWIFFAVAMFILFVCKNLPETEKEHKPSAISSIFLAVLLVWSVISLSGVSTFLYFNF